VPSTSAAHQGHARFGGHAIATTLLPPHPLQHRPLLVLDLDETLVHASIQPPAVYDHHFTVDMGATAPPVPVWVAVRPGTAEFLRDVSALFEVAVFTASIKAYADAVVDALDPYGRFVHHRLYREHCTDIDGVFVKDLSRLGRPLDRIAILDNSPHAYGLQPGNAIAILSWFDEAHDRELASLKALMHGLGQTPQGGSILSLLDEYREWQEAQERRRSSGRRF
jgi:RNA polymerase II subunit A small phosphatase-like protein